jgi:hypothetical protein
MGRPFNCHAMVGKGSPPISAASFTVSPGRIETSESFETKCGDEITIFFSVSTRSFFLELMPKQ